MIETSVFVVAPDFPELDDWTMLMGDMDHSFSRAKALGYDAVEIVMGDPDRFDVNQCANLLQRHGLKPAAINSGGIHYFFQAALVHEQTAKQQMAMIKLEKILQIASRLGCLVQIGVVRGDAWRGLGMPAYRRRLVSVLREVIQIATDLGVEMVLEYTNRWEINTLNTFDETRDIVDRVGSSQLGILLDTGHSFIEDDPDVYSTLLRARGYVKHLHFHDGDNGPAGLKKDLIDFDRIFDVLGEIGYCGFLSDGLKTTALPEDVIQQSTRYQHEQIHRLFPNQSKTQRNNMSLMSVKKPSPSEIDSTVGWESWTCEPSSFPWDYDSDEACYILEGKAAVTDPQGNRICFAAGDWVEFKKGLKAKWEVTEKIHKRYSSL